MNSIMIHVVGRAARIGVLLSLLGLSGCAGVTLQQIARENPSGVPRYTQVDLGGGTVRVYRAGREIVARRGLQLEPGDEIETGPEGAAVIGFLEQGDVILAAETRVRIGTLEVLFGRIFANVRGRFTASSENVVAGVEGTGFSFEIRPDRGVRVVVLDGVVAFGSRRAMWPTVRIGARQVAISPYPGRTPPVLERASAQEIEEIQRWVRHVTSAPPAPPVMGWCCAGRRIIQSIQERCPGEFSFDRTQVERACAPPEPVGWCCAAGRVTQSTQGRCAGQFYLNRSDAERVCATSPPQPMGWCCAEGSVNYVRRDACRGMFSTDKASADRACARRPEPLGWCCASGRVTQSAQGQCAGQFYLNRTDAERVCATPPPQPMVWCCAAGTVRYVRRDACRGTAYTSQASAEKACRPRIEQVPQREFRIVPESPEPVIR